MNDSFGSHGDLPADGGPESTWVSGPRRPRRRRRAFAVLLLLVSLPGLALLGANWWYRSQLDPAGSPGAEVLVTIEEGWGIGRIGDELVDARVIDSKLAYSVYTRLGDHTHVQAGDYNLRENMGIRAAVAALEAGPSVIELELAVIPGLWLDEVAAEVESQLGLDATRFVEIVRAGEIRSKYQPDSVTSTEGLLYPDTYRFADDVDEADVVRTMVERFDEVADSIGLADAAATTGRTPYEVAIVASLIQGEAKLDSDRPIIASVVYNRLRDGIELQIDATVLYAIGERKPSNTAEDRATPSPYNTYYAKGLPPTPIATITEVSLAAALNPAATDFFFYVLIDESGAHAFSRTYDEHLANVEIARARGLLG
jgi:UPF0755 protein